jgi:hypothetical protein
MTIATLEKKRTFARAYIARPSETAVKPSLGELKGQYNARLRALRGIEAFVDNNALPRHEREAKAGDLGTQARLLNDLIRRMEEAGYSPSTGEVLNGFTNNANIVSMQGAK